jgi:hypothetical protein
MSEIAEIRKLFQDLIAPDLKSLSAEQKSAEALAQARYETVLAKLEAIDAKHTARFDQILKALDIDKRMERVEEALKTSTHAA